jgi:hypothetical protein
VKSALTIREETPARSEEDRGGPRPPASPWGTSGSTFPDSPDVDSPVTPSEKGDPERD